MLKLMYITNNPMVAQIAQASGVDRIFVDLERIGKEQRQNGLDTVKSHHTIADVRKVRKVLQSAELLVRINPIHPDSQAEIEQVIVGGADVIMLPYFKSVEEVKMFLDTVNKRTKTCLLVETPQAVELIDQILDLDGFDEIHIGLNDLHLGYHMRFMFELLADDTVDRLCGKFRQKNLVYGFGGIARLGKGMIPAERIIAEHYRLGSGMAILSRSFCNSELVQDSGELKTVFEQGVTEIRRYEDSLAACAEEEFEENHREICRLVKTIAERV